MFKGSSDEFYNKGDLQPETLLAVKNDKLKIDYRKRDGYDHSYYYIATFIEEHFQFHANIWATQK